MNIFFDLDGTLCDSREGIVRSIEFALKKQAQPVPEASVLASFIGPPLIETFGKLSVPDPETAVHHYRQRYVELGIYEAALYSGTLAVLAELKQAGHNLLVATAKPHAYAGKVTAHFGIAPYMTAEFGPELDGTRNDKAELLAHALRITGCDPAKSLMIGDRHHDHIAAIENAMTSTAALWGYGTEEEHRLAQHRCKEIRDLPALVSKLGF